MFFQVQYDLRDVNLAEGGTFEISKDTPYPITLVIRRPLSGEDLKITPGDCLATVRTEEHVTDNVRPQFDVTDVPQPAVVGIETRIDDRLYDFMLRAVRIFRWRRGLTGHHNPIRYTRLLHWSDDGQTWKLFPGKRTLDVNIGIPCRIMSEALLASFKSLEDSGANEPLAHELFQEAWHQRTDSPRSSLLTGMTAAEVGFKAFVGSLVPQAEWLAFNAPTPPLIKMLTDYLPLLPVKQNIGVSPFIPTKLLESLKDGVTLRNKTAHVGNSVSREKLKQILIAVRDLLYLFDFYSGHVWAFEHISHEMRELIKSTVEEQKKKYQK